MAAKMNLVTALACALVALTACSQKGEVSNVAQPSGASGAIVPVATKAPAGLYMLDKPHASLTLRVSHLGFSNYTARFANFDAQLRFDPADPTKSSVTAMIDPTSLALNAPPPGFLDQLLGPQWLNAGQFPVMKFQSTAVELTGSSTARVTGNFTLHGITKPVILDVTFNGGYAGMAMDPHARIGFSAKGTFKRSDFGMSFGLPPPGTNMGVGDDVEVIIEAEFTGPPLAGAGATAPTQASAAAPTSGAAPASALSDQGLTLSGIAFVDSTVTGHGAKAQLPPGTRIYPPGSQITGTTGCPTNRYHTDGEIVAVIDYTGQPTAASLAVTRHPASGGNFQDAPYYIDLDPGRTLQFIGPIFDNGSYDLHLESGFAQAHPIKIDGSFTLARQCPAE
jgi:polyisoprenoid-binding protein YceI